MGCLSTEVKRSEASHEGEEHPVCGRIDLLGVARMAASYK